MCTFANKFVKMENFEEQLRKDLQQFLLSLNEMDERTPECPDVEEKWEAIAMAYIPDGIREFQDFPSASLGWMMYIGMAVAKMWDTEWEIYSKIEDLYAYMRDKARLRQHGRIHPRGSATATGGRLHYLGEGVRRMCLACL